MRFAAIIIISAFIFSFKVNAEPESEPQCKSTSDFVSYKAGIYAEKNNKRR